MDLHKSLTIDELLSLRNEVDPLIVLIDLTESTTELLRVTYVCSAAWFNLPTSLVASVSIIDFVTCQTGSYHKVSIKLREAADFTMLASVRQSTMASFGVASINVSLPPNVSFYSFTGGNLAVAHNGSMAIALAWIPNR